MSSNVAPPDTPPTSADAVVWVFSVPPEPAGDDWALLTCEERQHAAVYRFVRDRSAFVTARAAARRCLASELGLSAEAVPIVREPSGRLALRNNPDSAIDFNVSHSGALVAVAIGRGRKVGVDLECRRQDLALRSLVPDVMGPNESAMLDALDGVEFERAFYACWTRKEAIVKGIGLGMSYPICEIDLPVLPPDGVVRVPRAPAASHEDVWTVRTSELPSGCVLSFAVAGAGGTFAVFFPGRR